MAHLVEPGVVGYRVNGGDFAEGTAEKHLTWKASGTGNVGDKPGTQSRAAFHAALDPALGG